MKPSLTLLALVALILAVNSNPIQIAQSFIGNDFNNADGWTTIGAPADITVCSGTKMFGGLGKFGRRAVAMKAFTLPPHSLITLDFEFWKIRSWDNEQFHVWVDDQLVYSRAFKFNEGNQQKCGVLHNWMELIVRIKVDVKHTGSSAVVVLTSTLDEDAMNEAWGFRDFRLSASPCPDGCSACTHGQTQEQCAAWDNVAATWTSLDRLKLGADGWKVEGGPAEATQCGGLSLFGGFDKTGKGCVISRTFNLPPHYRLKLKLLMAKIDSWDNEMASLRVDGKPVWERRYQWHEGYFGRICGSPHADWREFFSRVEVEAAHTGATTAVSFTTTLNEHPNNESFGLRDFFLYIAKCAANCQECTGPKPSDCQKCANNWVVQDGACKPLANFVLLEQSFHEEQFTGLTGWTLKNNKGGASISKCGNKNLVGGFDIFGRAASAEKTFNVPPHSRLRLMANVYKIDSWDNEWMFVKVDGVDVWKRQWTVQTGGQNLCGQGHWPDGIFSMDEIFNHNAASAHVLLTSTLNEDANNESWGFRDFRLWYEPKEPCAVFFSECDYKGASYEFCAKSPNFQKDNIPPQIRSIRVPPQGRVTLYENTDYNGKKVVYTKDQPCITEFNFSFFQSHEIEGGWVEVPQATLQGQ